MVFKSLKALALAAAVLTPVTQALAADYDPPIYVDQAPDYQPVEVGSGWYLRGDVGYAFNKPYDFNESPTGVITDVSALSGSIGMGYHFNDYFRGELNFGLLPTSKFDNQYVTTCEGTETTTVTDNISGTITSQVSGPSTRSCDGSDYTRNKAYDVMASAYVDLGTYVGFTPYLGGGVGLAYSTYTLAQGARDCQDDSVTTVGGGSTTTTSFNCFNSSVYEGTITRERQYNLAYMLGAGFAYQVSKNVALDFGYEYVSVPSLKYATIDSLGTPSIHKGIDYQQVKVGLRYDLW